MASEVPLIELNADADEETLADAVTGVEVVIFCAETVSPAHRLRARKGAPPMLARVVEAARRARVGRLVHVSTADRSEEHTSELQSRFDLVCRLLLEKKKKYEINYCGMN